ncbi:MAG TPA: methyl-accepting chemotaxis protein [Devosia sp.]|nr:methyl-accepting chemotaxis protein [Devosia sp.]
MAFLSRLKISQKLPLALVGMAMAVGVGIGIAGYLISLSTVQAQRDQAMRASVESATTMVADYFAMVEGDLRLFTQRADTVAALENLTRSFNEMKSGLGDKASAQFQKAYVTDNPDQKARWLADTSGGLAASYDSQHKRFHPGFRTLMLERGYSDVFLFDLEGNLVYSTAKNPDFALNFVTDKALAATGLAQAVTTAQTLPQGTADFIDFAQYAPIGGAPASFMAMAVYKGDAVVGVMALEILSPALSKHVSQMQGLGETGEVVIVGADGLLRSESNFTEATDVLTTPFTADAVTTALAGTTATGTTTGHRDTTMVLSASPISVAGVTWAVVAVQAEAEVLAPVVQMRNAMVAIGVLLLLLASALSFLFARSVSRPISSLTDTMEALAQGDLEVEVRGADGKDEIGAMARAVEVFRENGQKVAQMTGAEAERIIRGQEERAHMMQTLQRAFGQVVDAAIAGDFSRRVDADFPDDELNTLARSVNNLVETVDRGLDETGEVLAALADTDLTRRMEGDYQGAFAQLKADTNAVADKLCDIVGQLRETSGALKTATGEILSGANDLSERTTKQAATIEETSAAMEQLASTVLQNAERARGASAVASTVTQTAEEGGQVMHQATEAMERITQSSGKISNIIGLIDDIAFQTNLLALNASVEAARAGDAGKGFAVVAVEVRRLAQSAAKASAEVKVLIEQSANEVKGGSRLVSDAATKLAAMLTAARSSNELMGSIAKESRDQAAAIDEVNTAVRTMDEMTLHNAALVEEINASIEQTEAQATELDRIVDIFSLEEAIAARPVAVTPLGAVAQGARGLQDKLKTAARSYLSHGNAAVDEQWGEF